MSDILAFATPLLNSILGCLYFQKLLGRRYGRIWVFCIWISAYLFAQLLMADAAYPANVFFRAALGLAVSLLMGFLLFYGTAELRIFAACSFVAGSELVRFIASAASSILHGILFTALYDPSAYTSMEAFQEAARRSAVYADMVLVCSVLLQFAVLGACLYWIGRQFPLPLRRLPLHEKLLFLLPALSALCVAVTLHMVVVSVESGMSVLVYDRAPATRFWIPLICLLLLGMIVSSALLFKRTLRYNEEEKSRLLLQKQLAGMQREVREIQDVYGDIRGLQHDMRGHLSNIHALLSGGNSSEIPLYVDKMEQTLNRLDFPVKTGSPITDIILARKRREAEEKGIALTMDFLFPAHLQIDAYDIGVVLDNALTNALEACEKSGGAVALRSYTRGALFFLETENPCPGEIRLDTSTGLPLSGKADAAAHGLGLSSIRRCAQKYHGDMDIHMADREGKRVFQLTVMMQGSGTDGISK